MEKIIKKYLKTLQSIELFREDGIGTPYGLEQRRVELHHKLFYEHILPMLNIVEGYDDSDAYMRSKEIFSRLDKVFRHYTMMPFDLRDNDCVIELTKILHHFLLSTEVIYFLELRTNFIDGVIDDNNP
jgi:hypothetical protein